MRLFSLQAVLVAVIIAVCGFGAGQVVGGNSESGTTSQRPAEPPRSPQVVRTSGQDEISPARQVYEATSGSVVHITVTERSGPEISEPQGFAPGAEPEPKEDQGAVSGTGFVLDEDGHILTNAHVVDGARKLTVAFKDGTSVSANVTGADASTDLAVIKIDPDDVKGDLVALEFASSKDVHVGDPVYAIGNPLGYDQTLTEGIISAVGRTIDAPNGFSIQQAIQTDAAINTGNSGGPLLNGDGRVVGVTSQIATNGSQGSIGIAFAIPSDLAASLVDELKSGEVRHAWLGVLVVGIDPQIAELPGVPGKGVIVQQLPAGSPAASAGLKAGHVDAKLPDGTEVKIGGDIILKVDGRSVTEAEELVSAVDAHKPGETIALDVLRDNKPHVVKVKLGVRPN